MISMRGSLLWVRRRWGESTVGYYDGGVRRKGRLIPPSYHPTVASSHRRIIPLHPTVASLHRRLVPPSFYPSLPIVQKSNTHPSLPAQPYLELKEIHLEPRPHEALPRRSSGPLRPAAARL